MTSAAKRILERLMDLSDSDRRQIAVRLTESLRGFKNPEIEAAWKVEIKRRMEEVDAGRVDMIPWEEARRLLHERLADGKSPRTPP